VTRNRIKRRLRHAADALQLEPGTDYVIIASGQIAEVEYTQVEGWLDYVLKGLTDV
jgi:ribonuclease P protein component